MLFGQSVTWARRPSVHRDKGPRCIGLGRAGRCGGATRTHEEWGRRRRAQGRPVPQTLPRAPP